ncbi:unnamed protein product, partial [Brassica rapa subsp. narinosa]
PLAHEFRQTNPTATPLSSDSVEIQSKSPLLSKLRSPEETSLSLTYYSSSRGTKFI